MSEHGVAFSDIDEATVRVFAVKNVEQTTVQGRNHQRVLGVPQAGHGTGVVVDPRGVIITAKHVVEGAYHIAVRLPGDGPVLPAVVVYVDQDLDFAILLVGIPDRLPNFIKLPESAPALAVRQTVDAVGYPLDADRRRPQSSRGIISGVLDDGHLQLDISVNPGNSGGPLLGAGGTELVGIVVARGDPSRGVQGIGIAVPIAPVYAAYQQALRQSMSAAHREVHTDALQRQRKAEVVDAIVRLGGVEVFEEAADVVEGAAASARLDRFIHFSTQTNDADLLGLLAAYFWDAAQVMVERAGGYPTPAQMPPGPARTQAEKLWRMAFELAEKARAADPSIGERSPFLNYLRPAGNSPVGGAGGVAPYSSAAWRPGSAGQAVGWTPHRAAQRS